MSNPRPDVTHWLGQVECLTAMWRDDRARKLEARGRAVAREARIAWLAAERARTGKGVHPSRCPVRIDATEPTRWHAARAAAQRARFRRAESCAKTHYAVVRCRHCGHEHEQPTGCGSRWICQRCRQATALRYQREFERRRLGAWWAVQAAQLDARWRGPQRLGQRFVTLTAPHEGQARVRVRTLLKAWDMFRRDLVLHCTKRLDAIRRRRDGGDDGLRNPNTGESLELSDFLSHLRVLEWTPGADGHGHPHFHVWLVSPYLSRRWLTVAWSRAWNRAAGRERGARRVCLVDVRAVKGERTTDENGKSTTVAAELCKYITKDFCADGSWVRPEVFGQVWAELDGRRLRQTSAGFARFELALHRVCPSCETELTRWSFYLRPMQRFSAAPTGPVELPPVPRDTGPPSRLLRDHEASYETWAALHWAELRVLGYRMRKVTRNATREVAC